MILSKELKDEIWEYCRVNDITAVDDFTLKLIKQGFTIEKFGATPITKTVEKIVEKIVEVPIQMIDTEMSQQLKDRILEIEKLKSELVLALDDSDRLRKELEIAKKKKDIYDEG